MTDRTPTETFTLLVRLHLDNDEGAYHEVRSVIADAIADATPSDMMVDVFGAERAQQFAERDSVGEALADFVAALARDADPDDPTDGGTVTLLGSDLLTHALDLVVDWRDLADDYIAEIRENEEIT